MKQVVQSFSDGRVEVRNVPEPQLSPRLVKIRVRASVVSAGTEKSKIKLGDSTLVGKAMARPDLVKKVLNKARQEGVWGTFRTVTSRLRENAPLGYSLSGSVLEIGDQATGLSPGDLVAAAGAGYANHAETVVVPHQLVVRLPEGVQIEHAAFTTIGAIAIQGVRQTSPQLGETFLVIGLGLIGQITVQLLRANGCRVLGLDLVDSLIDRAERYGAIGVRSGDELEARIRALTGGAGVDGVIITASTSSSSPVTVAGEVTREKGRVVVVGAVGMNLPREPYYMKEIDFRISRSYGPGRYDRSYEEGGHDYPYGYVRFTERRNMESFLMLLAEKKIDIDELITHRIPIDRAAEAYNLLRGGRDDPYLGILLEYGNIECRKERVVKPRHAGSLASAIGISFLGAGNYATSKLLPYLKNRSDVSLKGVCTASGMKAEDIADRFGFGYCTENVADILDEDTDVIFITTRHDTHASFAAEFLRSGKHVFVEKPLCLTQNELVEIEEALADSHGHLLVGYNRRFSPITQSVKNYISDRNLPCMINMIINAGPLDRNHWVQDAEVGGGRIIGEVCHFVDLASVLTESTPRKVFGRSLLCDNTSPQTNDNVSIQIEMVNGSVVTIIYTSLGPPIYPKERIEIFSAGRAALIDDFKRVYRFSGTSRESHRSRIQSKGQLEMLESFISSLGGDRMLIRPDELFTTSRATFAAVRSIACGQEIIL